MKSFLTYTYNLKESNYVQRKEMARHGWGGSTSELLLFVSGKVKNHPMDRNKINK